MADFYLRDLKVNNKKSVIEVAAKLIKDDIRKLANSSDHYPTDAEISNEEEAKKCIPESLQIFMNCLVPSTAKQISINHCILQAARPRSIIAPVPFALGVIVDKRTGSKWLINLLSHLGFSVTYDEVARYKKSAVVADSLNYTTVLGCQAPFMHWIADNVDHNTITLSGNGTFHGMGLVRVSANRNVFTKGPVPRLKERITASSVTQNRGVEIQPYCYNRALNDASITLKPVEESHFETPSLLLCNNFLWHHGWFVSSSGDPRPNWSGFLQCGTVNFGSSSKSTIDFLPIIDLNPNSETCVYSTLLFVLKEASKFNVTTPSITFDQPLYKKGLRNIESRKHGNCLSPWRISYVDEFYG